MLEEQGDEDAKFQIARGHAGGAPNSRILGKTTKESPLRTRRTLYCLLPLDSSPAGN